MHRGGLVKFTPQRIQLDLPKGTSVVVLREGRDYLFYLGEQIVFRMTGQEKGSPGTPVKTEHRLKVGLIFPMV